VCTYSAAGTYTAKVITERGTLSTQAQTTITVSSVPPPSDTTPPTVSLTAPTNGATVSGTVSITANATDNIAVQKVEFYRDSGVLLGIDTSTPFTYNWDTTTIGNGAHTVYAIATDTSVNTTLSLSRTVTVNNTVPPPPPPSSGGVIVKGNVTIAVSASSNATVTKVEFYEGSAALPFALITSAPFSAGWDSTTALNGTHTIAVRTFYASGETVDVTLTVDVSN